MSGQLDEVLGKLKKKYGAAIVRGSEIRSIELDRVSTGSLALDIETGGGLPFGRICELYGLESAGKSTLAMKVVTNVQKLGKPVVWIDAEGVFDGEWAKLLGIDLDKLTLAKPQTGEEAGDILVSVVQSGECGMVVLDSVGSLMPAMEQEKSMADEPERVGGIAALDAIIQMDDMQYVQQLPLVFVDPLHLDVEERIGIGCNPGPRPDDLRQQVLAPDEGDGLSRQVVTGSGIGYGSRWNRL